MGFSVAPAFEAGSVAAAEWPLCHVRLQDDVRFPWLILIPRVEGAVELEDLSVEQVEVEGQSARLLASSPRNEALLISADLRGPGYQLWPMHDGTSSPDASFAGGEVGVWLDGAVEGADAVVLTTEPTGESPVPTTDPLAIIRL